MIVYSTGCPQCEVLKKKLADKNVDFTLVENRDEVIKAAEGFGITNVPFMVVDDKVYNFVESINYINNL